MIGVPPSLSQPSTMPSVTSCSMPAMPREKTVPASGLRHTMVSHGASVTAASADRPPMTVLRVNDVPLGAMARAISPSEAIIGTTASSLARASLRRSTGNDSSVGRV